MIAVREDKVGSQCSPPIDLSCCGPLGGHRYGPVPCWTGRGDLEGHPLHRSCNAAASNDSLAGGVITIAAAYDSANLAGSL